MAKRQKDNAKNPKKVYGKDKPQETNLVVPNKAEETNANVDKENRRKEQQMKDTTTAKTKVYKDQCTAFISNLNLKASRNVSPLCFFSSWSRLLNLLY
jgi:hypothetical protein